MTLEEINALSDNDYNILVNGICMDKDCAGIHYSPEDVTDEDLLEYYGDAGFTVENIAALWIGV